MKETKLKEWLKTLSPFWRYALLVITFAVLGTLFILFLLKCLNGMNNFLKDVIIPIFTSNIPKISLLEYSASIVIGLMLAVGFCYALYFVLLFFNIKMNGWIFTMILLMLFMLISGLMVIDSMVGLEKDIKFVLRDEADGLKKVGSIHCSDNNGWIYVGETANCTIEPNLINATGKVTFTTYNDSITKDLDENLSFKAIERVSYVKFNIYGYDDSKKFRNLSVGWKYQFLTDELVNENQDRFLGYLFGLFSLIFVLIPSALAGIKSLSK